MPRAKPRPQPQAPSYPSKSAHPSNLQQLQAQYHQPSIVQYQYHQPPPTTYQSDSDVLFHANGHPSPPIPTTRTNAQLNLSVLQQHYPSTASILTLAPFAVLYTFSPSTQTWEKNEVEGTLFVCLLTPAAVGNEQRERYSVAILNRKGLDNFYLEMGEAGSVDVEMTDDFTILQYVEGREEEGKVWGLWIYEEGSEGKGGGRGNTSQVISECAGHVARGDGQEWEDGAAMPIAEGDREESIVKAPTTMGDQYAEVEERFDKASAELKALQERHQQSIQHDHRHPPQTNSEKEEEEKEKAARDERIRIKMEQMGLPTSQRQGSEKKPNEVTQVMVLDTNQAAQTPTQPGQQSPSHTPDFNGHFQKQPQSFPLFQPSADTQFFLSQGRGGLQQISRGHPSAPAPASQEGLSSLDALFAKAKSEYQGKGKL